MSQGFRLNAPTTFATESVSDFVEVEAAADPADFAVGKAMSGRSATRQVRVCPVLENTRRSPILIKQQPDPPCLDCAAYRK
jgi:hypothetical protein